VTSFANIFLQSWRRPHFVRQLVLSRLDYCNALLAGLPASTLAPFRWHAAALTVLDLKPRDRVTPALQELHWLPVAKRIQYKLCLLVHKSLRTHAGIYLRPSHIGCQYPRSIYSARFIVWQPRRAAETSTNRRQSLLSCCTASMEQAADGAETAAIDGLISSWSENISVSFCLRSPGYGLTLWCTLGLLVGGANTSASVTVTVTVTVTESPVHTVPGIS